MTKWTLLKDERGNWSSARCSWWLVVTLVVGAVYVDTLTVREVSAGAWTILGTLVMFTGGWAAGPRMAQYLFPQIGATVQAIGQAARRGLDNARKDDERG